MIGRAVVGFAMLLAALLPAASLAQTQRPEPRSDVLVTFANEGKRIGSTGVGEPYRKRKRYSMKTQVRQHAADIADEFGLTEVDRWPIRSLGEFCFVYRVPADSDRDGIIQRLRADSRVASAQALHRFEALASQLTEYDDTYASLQRGLDVMQVPAAHRYSSGQGVHVAIIDSRADFEHEDLKGRVSQVVVIPERGKADTAEHGTAVASIIGANANNARGIVGVAPEATMTLYVACWTEDGEANAVCDSFTLAKALDAMLAATPDVLNMSLTGPYDPLLERLLNRAGRAGIITVAAVASPGDEEKRFPANLESVIGVGSSDDALGRQAFAAAMNRPLRKVHAPGHQIMVAIPGDGYDFRSGNSLAAAHVTGVVALLLAASPDLPRASMEAYLQRSRRDARAASSSVNACVLLQLLDGSRDCAESATQEVKTGVSGSPQPGISTAPEY